MASFVSSSLNTGRLIFIWPPISLWHWWPQCLCPEPLDPTDCEDIDEAVDIELQSLLNLGSSEGEGNQGGAAHCCHCLWPLSWPLCLAGLGSHPGVSHHSTAIGNFGKCGGQSGLMKLNFSNTDRMVQGHPGPLGSMCHLVMAWEINHRPSPRFTGLALSRLCLPTQLIAPDNVHAASWALPKLNPYPREHDP